MISGLKVNILELLKFQYPLPLLIESDYNESLVLYSEKANRKAFYLLNGFREKGDAVLPT